VNGWTPLLWVTAAWLAVFDLCLYAGRLIVDAYSL